MCRKSGPKLLVSSLVHCVNQSCLLTFSPKQAVRRQLASFQAAVSKQMGQLEARAEQLSGYAARLGFACQRIHFALRLLAGRRPGRAGPPGSGGVQLPGGHTGRTQALLQALGGQVQAVAGALDAGQRHLPAPQGEGGSLVGVLQQEVRRLAADRDALLQQLVEVSRARCMTEYVVTSSTSVWSGNGLARMRQAFVRVKALGWAYPNGVPLSTVIKVLLQYL